MLVHSSSTKPSNSNHYLPEIGAPTTMDSEGRIITLEFEDFYVTQVYTPNAGDGLKRLLTVKSGMYSMLTT